MLGTGDQLFDHIAECLAHFVKVRASIEQNSHLPN